MKAIRKCKPLHGCHKFHPANFSVEQALASDGAVEYNFPMVIPPSAQCKTCLKSFQTNQSL
jgi:hypothetical protein